jgi:hypothetical protein
VRTVGLPLQSCICSGSGDVRKRAATERDSLLHASIHPSIGSRKQEAIVYISSTKPPAFLFADNDDRCQEKLETTTAQDITQRHREEKKGQDQPGSCPSSEHRASMQTGIERAAGM